VVDDRFQARVADHGAVDFDPAVALILEHVGYRLSRTLDDP
jgi:hypothetical protein